METTWSVNPEQRPRFDQVKRTIERIIACESNHVNTTRSRHNSQRACSLMRNQRKRSENSQVTPRPQSEQPSVHNNHRHSSAPDLLNVNCDWTQPYFSPKSDAPSDNRRYQRGRGDTWSADHQGGHRESLRRPELPSVFPVSSPQRRYDRQISYPNHTPDYRAGFT